MGLILPSRISCPLELAFALLFGKKRQGSNLPALLASPSYNFVGIFCRANYLEASIMKRHILYKESPIEIFLGPETTMDFSRLILEHRTNDFDFLSPSLE
jgi:hypothetical protein